jgi:dihydroorotate dehydrogenase
MSLYPTLVRPLLFQLSSDRAHDLAQWGFRWPPPWRIIGRRVRDPRLRTSVAGIPLENPVGLAPGFDKNGESLRSLDHLGFGYIVIGSITRYPRPGNPRPRMGRYPEREALINNLGLPSLGLDSAMEILSRGGKTVAKVIASVTGFTADELVEAAASIEPLVDAVELGLVCPNTTESQRMAELSILEEVVGRVVATRSKPVFLRLPPHHDEGEWSRARAMLDVCMEHGLEGVAVNGRSRIVDSRLPNDEGSISGKPTFPDALRIVRDVAEHTEGRLAIRASGGVFTGEDAAQMLKAGATTVEIYSSFVYRGPSAPGLINRELLEIMAGRESEGIEWLRNENMAR